MASSKVTGSHDGLITVQEYADRHGVDASIVRSWVKGGHIRAVLVGPRMMRLDAVEGTRPVVPSRAGKGIKTAPDDPLKVKREELVGYLIAHAAMDRDTARSVVEGMDPEDVEREHAEYDGKVF